MIDKSKLHASLGQVTSTQQGGYSQLYLCITIFMKACSDCSDSTCTKLCKKRELLCHSDKNVQNCAKVLQMDCCGLGGCH